MRKIAKLIIMPSAFLIVLLTRLLRPFIIVRFGPLNSSRIGHLSTNTELYMCERDAGMHPNRTMDFFYHVTPLCNYQLKKMWQRKLRICAFASMLDRINRIVPGSKRHTIDWSVARDIHNLFDRFPAHLSFTPDEEHIGNEELKRMGIPKDAPFICFHSRDEAYLSNFLLRMNWSYHDYRDSSIGNYMQAAQELTRRGYFLIRMGAIVKEQLNTDNPRIIDYASKFRSDFMDIYLSAKCRFFLGSPTGIVGVSMIFRRPVLCANFVPLEYLHSWNRHDLNIPKKIWSYKKNRFLTFREILNSKVGRFAQAREYYEAGLEPRENSPEEITCAAIEMEERLRGVWKTTKEDEELQRRFWRFFSGSQLHGKIFSKIGADFLARNQMLLN